MSGIVSGLNRGGDSSSGLVNKLPAHTVVQSVLLSGEAHSAGHISSTSTTYTNSGVYGSFKPKYNSNQSWLKVQFQCGMQQFQTNTVTMDCTLDDSNSTSYAGGNSLGAATGGGAGNYSNRYTGTGNQAVVLSWVHAHPHGHAGSHEADASPSNQTSYNAGQLYYVRIYFLTEGGTFYFIHQDTYWNFWLEEIMRPGVEL